MNEWVWDVGGIVLTGENRSTGGKICPSATSSTANLKWTDLGSKTRLRGERPTTNRLSQLNPGVFIKIRFQPPSKHTASPLQTPDAYNGGLLWESHDRARERMEQWRTGNWRRASDCLEEKPAHCDSAVGIGCVCVVSHE